MGEKIYFKKNYERFHSDYFCGLGHAEFWQEILALNSPL